MLAIRPMVDERIEELDTMGSVPTHAPLLKILHQTIIVFVELLNRFVPFLGFPVIRYLVKDLYFIIGSLQVMLGTFLDFHSNIVVVF